MNGASVCSRSCTSRCRRIRDSGGDVVGQQQLLASQRERERSSTDPGRQLDAAGSVVVVRRLAARPARRGGRPRGGGCRRATHGDCVGRAPSGRRREEPRLVHVRVGLPRDLRKVPEVDARLAHPRPGVDQPGLTVLVDVGRREPDEAEPVGVGEAVVDPRRRRARRPGRGRARARSPPSAVVARRHARRRASALPGCSTACR